MIITKTDRTNAEVVLAIIQSYMDSTDSYNAEWKLDFYHNGRENGYVLKLNIVDGKYIESNELWRWIAFSEYRRSDDTVIYTDCGFWDGDLTEKSYEKAQFFDYGNFIEAAEHILNIMKDSIDAIRKYRKEREAA